ncbi:hypothetical protein EDC04DRAFT_2607628 [Pisolithus marmoratus]|nr:hypothetical protein EDC04DRAFT_2607628 [Pisolithus marmoratus]
MLHSQTQRCTSEQKQANNDNLQWAKEAELATTQKAYECIGVMESVMAASQIQGSLEKPIRPKPQPQSAADQRNSDLEADIGPKERDKTVLKLRSAINQAHKRAEAETQSSITKDTNHEQAEVASKPREDKIMSKLRGVIEKASKPLGNTASSGHVQAMCGNKVANMTPLSDMPRRQWGLSEIDPLTPDEDQDYKEHKTASIINDEYSDVENIGKADVFDTHHVNGPALTAPNLKQKRSSSVADNSEHAPEVDTVYEEENKETSVSAIDAIEPCRVDKGIGPGHHIICHQVQKSRSSIAPSVASDVPTSDFPKSEATHTSNSGSHFTNSDLSPLFLKGRKWAKTYLPTLLLWLGDQPNVWSVPKGDLVHALMEITKVMYPTFTTLDDICPNMPASQCLSRWHHSMGSTAITLLECYLASDPDTDVEQMCDTLLHKQAFAYEDLDSHTPEEAFRSAFILQLLANMHLHSCAGSVDFPALGLTPKPYMVRGTIMLCVAALEHAIKQVKSQAVSTDAMGKGQGGTNFLKSNHKHKSSGRPANAEHTFLEQNWGSTTSSYFQSITNRGSHILQGIVRMAYAVLQDNLDDNSSMEDQTEELLEGEVDAHVLMYTGALVYKRLLVLFEAR